VDGEQDVVSFIILAPYQPPQISESNSCFSSSARICHSLRSSF
jgi:hypothetical protein